jgi:hypothetical protein
MCEVSTPKQERMQNMDQQGRYDTAHAVTGTESANYPPGVAVYDADGEKLGTVSDWQDKRNFLVVHKGRLFGHDTDIPHAAIQYSEMNGVYLRVRKDELISMKQTPLSELAAPILKCPPILVPDMGATAVAAAAFADHAMPAPDTICTVRPADEAPGRGRACRTSNSPGSWPGDGTRAPANGASHRHDPRPGEGLASVAAWRRGG